MLTEPAPITITFAPGATRPLPVLLVDVPLTSSSVYRPSFPDTSVVRTRACSSYSSHDTSYGFRGDFYDLKPEVPDIHPVVELAGYKFTIFGSIRIRPMNTTITRRYHAFPSDMNAETTRRNMFRHPFSSHMHVFRESSPMFQPREQEDFRDGWGDIAGPDSATCFKGSRCIHEPPWSKLTLPSRGQPHGFVSRPTLSIACSSNRRFTAIYYGVPACSFCSYHGCMTCSVPSDNDKQNEGRLPDVVIRHLHAKRTPVPALHTSSIMMLIMNIRRRWRNAFRRARAVADVGGTSRSPRHSVLSPW
ncbi:hypothetical protein A0H81_04117 [Grifola frondosa]|uniref:Uncharacterized protein n=1 Tax=Grifola frondosa TaxID=5627 RepID=A0A1C7MGD0_GRIFR|nr:hypothetical protein A0H81_04117 [Grifola frondosa]